MEARDILRIFLMMVAVCFYIIAARDCKKLKKVIRQEQTETLKDKFFEINARIIKFTIIGSIFALVAVLLLYKII